MLDHGDLMHKNSHLNRWMGVFNRPKRRQCANHCGI